VKSWRPGVWPSPGFARADTTQPTGAGQPCRHQSARMQRAILLRAGLAGFRIAKSTVPPTPSIAVDDATRSAPKSSRTSGRASAIAFSAPNAGVHSPPRHPPIAASNRAPPTARRSTRMLAERSKPAPQCGGRDATLSAGRTLHPQRAHEPGLQGVLQNGLGMGAAPLGLALALPLPSAPRSPGTRPRRGGHGGRAYHRLAGVP
jgi:hypothetical protein